MSLILDFISQYWGLGATGVVVLGYYFTHRTAATAYAKKKIISLMFSAEKEAEKLLLENGQAKFNWVVDKGYNLLPAPVRLFISYPLFKSLVQSLFDEAIAFAKSHQIQDKSSSINIDSQGNMNITGGVIISAKTINGSEQIAKTILDK